MQEIIKHMHKINTAAYVVAGWALYILFMLLFLVDYSVLRVSPLTILMSIFLLVMILVLTAGIIAKRYKFLWLVFSIIVIDTIFNIALGLTKPLALILRIIVIGFIVSAIRSYLLLNKIKNFNPTEDKHNIGDSSYIDPDSQSRLQNNEFILGKNREDFNSDEDFYCYILNVNKTSTVEEIKRAYRLKMKTYHPDRYEHLGDEFRKIAEENCKLINNALYFFKIKYNFN